MKAFVFGSVGSEQGTCILRPDNFLSDGDIKLILNENLEKLGQPDIAFYISRKKKQSLCGVICRSGRKEKGVSERTANHSFWGWKLDDVTGPEVHTAILLINLFLVPSTICGSNEPAFWVDDCIDSIVDLDELQPLVRAFGCATEVAASNFRRIVHATQPESSSLDGIKKVGENTFIVDLASEKTKLGRLIRTICALRSEWEEADEFALGLHDLDYPRPFCVASTIRLKGIVHVIADSPHHSSLPHEGTRSSVFRLLVCLIKKK